MDSFQTSTWADVEALRANVVALSGQCVEDMAQSFAESLAAASPTVVLARLFLVLPLGQLSTDERIFVSHSLRGVALTERTPILSLLGSAGKKEVWRDRTKSKGHRAIALLGSEFVQGAPMLAKLLADLEVDLAGLDDGNGIATRRMLGGSSGAFFVEDAASTRDGAGRFVIPSQDFVAENGVQTVFGMGGAYVNGTLAVAIVFTNERIDRAIVDRYPSLIGNFKMVTSTHLLARRIY